MSKIQKLSGHELIKVLFKVGFRPKRQKGSHVILIKETERGKVGCTVPLHKELKIGTIKGTFVAKQRCTVGTTSVLKQAGISEEEFVKLLKR